MLSKLSLTQKNWPNDQYSGFTVEPLHLLQLRISKKLKKCTVSYLSSSKKAINGVMWTKHPRKINSYKFHLLNACNSLLFGYKMDFMVSDLQVDFSSALKTGQLNGFFTSAGVKGMLEGKDYSSIDMVFPFIAALIDRANEYSVDPKPTTVYTMYSDLVNYLMFKSENSNSPNVEKYELKENIKNLKAVAKDLFGNLEDINPFTLKFHMLDHDAEDEKRFGTSTFLDASPYEHYNYVIKTFIIMKSMRKSTLLEEAVTALNSSSLHDVLPEPKLHTGSTTALSKNGYEIRLEGISSSEYPMLAKLSKDAKRALVKYVMECANDDENGSNIAPLPSDMKINVVKSGNIRGGSNITLDDYDHDNNSIMKNIFIGTTRQRVFADETFGPTCARRYRVVPVEGEGQSYWFAKVLLLFT